MKTKKQIENRKKLRKLIDRYISKVVMGTSWTIDRTKDNMARAIEKIMRYKKT